MAFNAATLNMAARRLAKETGFSAAEITGMPFNQMVWWLME